MNKFLLGLLFTRALSYQFLPHVNKRTHLKLTENDISKLQLIQNQKSFFFKDNYNNILKDVLDHKVSKIYIDINYKDMVSVDNINQPLYNHYHIANVNEILVSNIVSKASEGEIPIHFIDFTPTYISTIHHVIGDILGVTGYIIPAYLLISFISFLAQFININTNPLSRNPFNLMPNNRNTFEPLKQNVSLSSWAGSPEVLEECKEVISYLENKELFSKLGAEMPKGILLEGPPGTGKTLLAKGIATETNASFISISGSEFIELFVGMGAARVRELFTNARNNRPCVIFIDEIDAVGRQRGAGINMGNDEREQTLNQILYEMDGFNNNDNILVLAATNRKDVLDQALLRPGRFDRIIRVPLPDKFSREQILDFYLKLRPVEKSLNILELAEITDGFSGAQLKNLINEAAIMSAKKNATMILETDLMRSFEKSIIGLVKNNTVSLNTKKRVAIHEAGHAFLTLMFEEYFKLQKVSIQATYNGAGGYTLFTEKADIKEGLYTKDVLKKRLIILLGGKAAENIFYGEDFVSVGAVEDLKQANRLANRMIGNFGMGESLEVFYNENMDNPFLGKSLSIDSKYSDSRRSQIDNESLSLVIEAYTESKNMIFKFKNKILKMSELLIEKTTLNQEDIQLFREINLIEDI
jgi:cell division protease FtsH